MPIETAEIRGTESDGTHNAEYCRYCYENGAYTMPDLTLDEMKSLVGEQIGSMHLPPDLKDDLIAMSAKLLPGLKRWK